MNGSQIELAVLELVATAPMQYGTLINAVPDVSPEKVARAAWRLRRDKKLRFRLISQGAGVAPLHMVEVAS